MVNMPYTFALGNLKITGGNSGDTYTAAYTGQTGSEVPPGLSLGSDNQSLVGTPTSTTGSPYSVKVTVTDTTTNATASTTFTLPVVPETVAATTNTGYLKGQYACFTEQFKDTGSTSASGSGNLLYRQGSVFAFTASGGGSITGGELDTNSPSSGYKSPTTNGALSGSYAVGSDNRGYLLLATANNSGSIVFALAGGNLNSNSHFSEFALTEMDDAGTSPAGKHGGGHCYLQSPASSWNTASAALSGSYAFGFRDESSDGDLGALAGYVDFNSTSSSVSGESDQVQAGTFNKDSSGAPTSLTGTYTNTVDSYGRTTMTVGPSGGQSPFVVYLTDNSVGEMLIMTTPSHGNGTITGAHDLFIGQARAQNATAVSSSTPLSGPFVLYMSGPDCCGNFKANVMQVSANDYVVFENDNETLTINSGSGSSVPYTYPAASVTSRGTFNMSSAYGADLFYVYNTNSAVVLFADGQSSGEAQGLLGWIEPQTAPTSGTWALSDMSSASGTSYFMRSLPNWSTSTDSQSGAFTATSGAMTPFAQDDGSQNSASWDENFSSIMGAPAAGSIALDPTYGQDGVFDVNVTPTGGTAATISYCAAISVNKATNSSAKGRFACVNASKSSPDVTIGQE